MLDLERHGRDGWGDDLDLSRTVGWFTAIAPVRLPAGRRTDDTSPSSRRSRSGCAPRPTAAWASASCATATRAPRPRSAGCPHPQLLFNYLGRWAADGTGDWDSAPEVDALRVGPDPDLGTPYLLEINAHLRRDRRRPACCARRSPTPTASWAPTPSTELGEHWVAVLRELGELGRRGASVGGVPDAVGPAARRAVPADRSTASPRRAPQPVEDIWPLSPLQEGVYFQARYATAAVYIVQNVFDFADPIDVDALRTAYSAVMQRNPVLRSAFWADDLPQPVAAIAVGPGLRARDHRPDRAAAADVDRDGSPRSPPTTGCAPSTWPRRRWPG